jgi:predicted permease
LFVESLAQDVRCACRGARRSPLFAVSVAGTIGIGLGVLCAWFTIVNAYLFKAVRLPQPTELHGLSWDSSVHDRYVLTLAEFEALAADTPVFAQIAAGNSVVAALPSGQSMAGHLVTGEYFAVLGAPAALGRLLTSADLTASASATVLVLSDAAWRRYFNADPSIVGREIVLAGAPLTVIGVTRPGATLPGDETIAFWAPLTLATTFDMPDPATSQERSLFVVGRRRAGLTADQVRAWFGTWVRQRFTGTELEPVRTRTDSLATRLPLTGATRTLFMLLTSAFGLVLLIACANAANMLLARGLSRQRELGIRISLGASRSRLIRQLLIESSVLAVPAAGVALLCTFATAWGFPRLVTSTLPAGAEVIRQILVPFDPDMRVLTVLVVAGWLAALLAGLSPAMQVTSLVDAMRGQIRSGIRASRLRSVFVTVQVATCVLFLVAALAFVAESRRMGSAETGLDYERIVTVHTPAALRPAIAAELAARADVAAVSAAWRPPLMSPMPLLRVTPQAGVTQSAGFMAVSPGYFDTLGVRVLRGREFTRAEAEQHAALILVSEATARLFWPGRDPIDQKLDIAAPLTDRHRQPAVTQVTVIGIVEDVVNGTLLDGVARTSVYFPAIAADPEAGWLLVRTHGDAAVPENRIAKALHDAHPATAIEVGALLQHAAVQVWSFRLFSTASGLLAAMGLLLAFAGVYGVVAFLMTQRTREFGIRMALGATAGRIVRNVVSDAIRTATLAAVLGLCGTAGIMRGIAAISGLRPVISPSIYTVGAVIVVVAAAIASLIPAMRATKLDPSAALRAD